MAMTFWDALITSLSAIFVVFGALILALDQGAAYSDGTSGRPSGGRLRSLARNVNLRSRKAAVFVAWLAVIMIIFMAVVVFAANLGNVRTNVFDLFGVRSNIDSLAQAIGDPAPNIKDNPKDTVRGVIGRYDDMRGTIQDQLEPVGPYDEKRGTIQEQLMPVGPYDSERGTIQEQLAALGAYNGGLGIIQDQLTIYSNQLAANSALLGDYNVHLTGYNDGLEISASELGDVNDRLAKIEQFLGIIQAEDVGPCISGLELSPNQACGYAGLGNLRVSDRGAAFPTEDARMLRGYLQADWIIQGEHHTLQAVEETAGRWKIYAAGQWQLVEDRDCQVGATIEPGYFCVWRGNVFRVYATNDLVTDREHTVQFTAGYAHLDLQFWFNAYDDQVISVTDEFEDKQGNPVIRKFIAQRDPESTTRAWIIICAD